MATVEELQADRDAIYAARLTFLTTGSIKEVSRAGRKLVRENPKLEDFDNVLAALDAEIAGLGAVADGGRRRRAFSVSL